MTGPVDLSWDEWRRWRPFVLEDLRAATACVAAQPPAVSAAAYHCQQAAEKLVKGLLSAARVPFRRIHDLEELADQAAPLFPQFKAHLDACRGLTVWASDYRYPMEDELPPPQPEFILEKLNELEQFLKIADDELRCASGDLPP